MRLSEHRLARPRNRPAHALAIAVLLLAGCASTEGQQQLNAELQGLQRQLDTVSTELSETRAEIAARDASASAAGSALAEGIAGLDSRLDTLPEELAKVCPEKPAVAAAATAQCEPKVEVRTVTVSSDKLVVGELERVWIEPPGASLVVRIDTGADSSSLHAEDLVEFERDGARWARFSVAFEGGPVTLERPIKRFARVVQQSDPKGSRRPVVDLRVRLGNVRETVDFTLADRSRMDNEMLLGRNFLTDVAVVDVGQQFVQPPVKTTKSTAADPAPADKER
jgi:outer membrane murein-binding lipoprotein Lpp